MTLDEFRQRSREILTKMENPEEVGAIIDVLDGAFQERDAAALTAEATIADLTERNDRLQKANMELFLRTGVQGKADDLSGTDQDEGVDFSTLFGENGELK